MNWQGVCEFVAVAETNSFTQAGKRLGISTAQVSRQIVALENRLDIALFYRTTRKVSLTYEGQIYYQHCRKLLDDLVHAEQAITHLHDSPQGHLNITAPTTYGEQFIVPLVNDFALQYPNLSVSVFLTNQTVDLVKENFDLAIRIGKLSDSRLMYQKISTRASYVCGASQYFDMQGYPNSLDELVKHNCLLGTHSYWRFLEDGRERLVKVRGSLHCNSGHGLLDAALKGLGLVQLPDYYVEPFIQSGELIRVLDSFQGQDEGIWAVYPENHHLLPKVSLLVDYFKQAYFAR